MELKAPPCPSFPVLHLPPSFLAPLKLWSWECQIIIFTFFFPLDLNYLHSYLNYLSLTSNLYIHILTIAQLWLLLGCFTLSTFLHIPTFPISVSCGSQGLVMGTHVVCFYCLGDVLESLAFHPPALTLPVLLWYQFPSMTTGGRGGSNSRRSSHKGETGEDWLVLDPVDQGVHPGSRTGAGGKTQAFPSGAISHWLWSSWKEGAVLPGGAYVCQLLVLSWVVAEGLNGEGFKAHLKSSPWGNPHVSAAHLRLYIQTS